MKLIVPIIWNKANQPVAKATCRINVGTSSWNCDMTNSDGMCNIYVGDELQNTQFEVYACGYRVLSVSVNLGTDGNKQIRVGIPADPTRPHDIILPALALDEPDFPVFSREAILKFRGSLNIKPIGIPMPPVNINGCISINGIWHQPDDVVEGIFTEHLGRSYTHGPMGPFIDPGYHNLTPPTDFRIDSQRDKIEKSILNVMNHKIIPSLFITPDGWTVEQLRSLEGIFKSSIWQKLAQCVVNGFEQQGSQYGWSNSQYCEYGAWLREVFPNAVIGLHTISGIEAPVGNGDDTSKPGMSLNECWGRVAGYYDYWLTQFDVWDYWWTHVDPSNPDHRTDLQHWYDLWDANKASSFVQRFNANGTWPLAKNLIPIAGEFWSYGLCWNNLPEEQGRSYGRHAIDIGAHGSFDGC